MTTTWRDQLYPGSFRGVPFFVESESMPVGRRTQVHEYPQRDKPLVEDMGKVTRKPKFSAFVIGDDCLAQRDDLLRALEEPGAGELIHPWYGRMRATAGDCEATHERREGGLVRFDLAFIEDGEKGFPAGVPNAARQLEESSESLLDSAINRYKSAMAIVNRARLAVVVLQNSIAGLQMAIAQEFGKIVGLVGSVEALADMLINAPGNFAAMIRGQFADLTGHSRASGYRWGPSASSSRASGSAVSGGSGSAGSSGGSAGSGSSGGSGSTGGSSSGDELEADPEFARTVAGLAADEPEFSTYADSARAIASKVEVAQALNAAMIIDRKAGNPAGGVATVAVVQAARELVREALLVAAARAAATMPVSSAPAALPGSPSLAQQVASPIWRPDVPAVDEVVALREALSTSLWDAGQHVSHSHFEVLETVRRQVRAHLSEVARSGVRLTTTTTHESLPAVVVAYQCFGDASRAAEIVTRNKVDHPGFLPAGELKVAQE